MKEIQLEDFKLFLYEHARSNTLNSLAVEFYRRFEIPHTMRSDILKITDNNEAKKAIWKQFMLH